MEILGNLYLDIKLDYRYIFYRQTYTVFDFTIFSRSPI